MQKKEHQKEGHYAASYFLALKRLIKYLPTIEKQTLFDFVAIFPKYIARFIKKLEDYKILNSENLTAFYNKINSIKNSEEIKKIYRFFDLLLKQTLDPNTTIEELFKQALEIEEESNSNTTQVGFFSQNTINNNKLIDHKPPCP